MKEDILLLSVGFLALAGAAVGGFYYWGAAGGKIAENEPGQVKENMPHTNEPEKTEDSGNDEEKVEFSNVAKGFYGSREEKGNLVIHSEAELTSNIDTAGLLGIDFAHEMAVAVFSGTKPTGGYSVEITKIIETDTEIVVTAVETSPGADCIVTQAFTSPYSIVKIPKLDKKVTFDIEAKVTNCR